MVLRPYSRGLVGGASVWSPALCALPLCCLLPVQQEGCRLLNEGDNAAILGEHVHGGGKVFQESHHILSLHLIADSVCRPSMWLQQQEGSSHKCSIRMYSL